MLRYDAPSAPENQNKALVFNEMLQKAEKYFFDFWHK